MHSANSNKLHVRKCPTLEPGILLEEKRSITQRTERDDYGLHINKSNGLHRRYSVSNTTTKDIKYTVCMKRTIVSNLTITLCEPLESLTKRDHSITEYYSSSSILDQNHPFFLKAVQIQSSNLFIIKNLIIMK